MSINPVSSLSCFSLPRLPPSRSISLQLPSPRSASRHQVTTPRSDIMYVVTEYGCVNLKGQSLADRARLLISIAHPVSMLEVFSPGGFTPLTSPAIPLMAGLPRGARGAGEERPDHTKVLLVRSRRPGSYASASGEATTARWQMDGRRDDGPTGGGPHTAVHRTTDRGDGGAKPRPEQRRRTLVD